jgi:hypothetical protein
MTTNNDSFLQELLKIVGSFLSVTLPLLQLLAVLSDKLPRVLFISNEAFLVASIISLISSISVSLAFLSSPYFRFTLQKKKEQIYLGSLPVNNTRPGSEAENEERTPSVSPPLYVDAQKLGVILTLIAICLTPLYLWIGLEYSSDISSASNFIIIVQSVLYIFIFNSLLYSLVAFTYRLIDYKKFRSNDKERIQKAINLAIEHNGFPELKTPNFITTDKHQEGYTQYLRVFVKLDDKIYRIVTDSSADVLYAVLPESNDSNTSE